MERTPGWCFKDRLISLVNRGRDTEGGEQGGVGGVHGGEGAEGE